MAYNPVLLFKPQGESDTCGLSKDDFMLVIQTEFQKGAMIQYGTKGVQVDATHGTTQYDFLLITVLVVDNHGEGLPVAWAISNKEAINAIALFFQSIYRRVGQLDVACFMSDCAEQYFNAWSVVFGCSNTKKLLCVWHVDRAWRPADGDELSTITSVKSKTEWKYIIIFVFFCLNGNKVSL